MPFNLESCILRLCGFTKNQYDPDKKSLIHQHADKFTLVRSDL